MTTRTDANWRLAAACREGNPAMFDDSTRASWPPPRAVEAAHDFCAACPVRSVCDAFADSCNEVGVWAGKWRHRPGDSDPYAAVEIIDMLTPRLASVPNLPVPEGLAPRVEKAWRALPAAGFTTTGRIAAEVGTDPREASRSLGMLAARGLAESPTRGVWRRATPDTADVELAG